MVSVSGDVKKSSPHREHYLFPEYGAAVTLGGSEFTPDYQDSQYVSLLCGSGRFERLATCLDWSLPGRR